jgi:hypothetical protein
MPSTLHPEETKVRYVRPLSHIESKQVVVLSSTPPRKGGRIWNLSDVRKCENFEARQIAVRERRSHLSMAGTLTPAEDDALDLEERQIVGDLKDHQALEHDHDKVYEGSDSPRLKREHLSPWTPSCVLLVR